MILHSKPLKGLVVDDPFWASLKIPLKMNPIELRQEQKEKTPSAVQSSMIKGDANMYHRQNLSPSIQRNASYASELWFRSKSIWIHPRVQICKSESIWECKLRLGQLLTCKWGRWKHQRCIPKADGHFTAHSFFCSFTANKSYVKSNYQHLTIVELSLFRRWFGFIHCFPNSHWLYCILHTMYFCHSSLYS